MMKHKLILHWLRLFVTLVASSPLVLFLLTLGCNSTQQQREYVGSLEPELTADTSSYYAIQMKPVANPQRIRMSSVLSKGSEIFQGELIQVFKESPLQVLLVEPAQGDASLYADIDQNGLWASSESFTFVPCKDIRFPGDSQVSFRLPLPDGYFYKSYPVVIRRPAPVKEPAVKRRGCTLFQARGFCVQGTFGIQNKKTLVQYQNMDLQTGRINPSLGWLGIDSNGDGRIDYSPFSIESVNAFGEAVIFRVGDIYLSTKSADGVSGKVILREHSPAEYQIIEVRDGAQVPDFDFVDFNGKARRLSDFNNKYLLLEFWGTWCPPCVAAIPALKEAYSRYHSRGFEILGMDMEIQMSIDPPEALKNAKIFIADKAMPWPQATTESIRMLVERRFRIMPYPASILLDRERRIVSYGKLDNLKLMDTLEKLLPAGS